ncbi:MAG: SDR family NAD(P)-dependent oxidoreductase [Hyphomicrobiaceae bacterium]
MTTLSGRTAIVTGAARGIGLATAEALARAGARALLVDIDDGALRAATTRLSDKGLIVDGHVCDVSQRESVMQMIKRAADMWGGLDILVNNAAITDDTPLHALTPERWRSVMAVNLDSVLHCVAAAEPHLRRSKSASIVNVASTQGLRGQPNALAYATAKGGVVNLTRCLAVDLGPAGIRVNAVAPGFVDTRMAIQSDGSHEHSSDWFQDVYIRHGRLPLRRAGLAEDIAGPIAFLAGDGSRYITGQVVVVDGGFMCTY